MDSDANSVTESDLHKLAELRELLTKFELEKYEEALTFVGIDTVARLGRVPEDLLLEFFKGAKVPPMHQRDFRALCNSLKPATKNEVTSDQPIPEPDQLNTNSLLYHHLPAPSLHEKEHTYNISKHYWEQRSDDILYQLAEKLEKWDKEGICADKLETKEFALIIRESKACVKCSCGHLSPIFVRRDRKRGPISFQRLRDHLKKHKGTHTIIHTASLTPDLSQIPSLPPFQLSHPLSGMEHLYKDDKS